MEQISYWHADMDEATARRVLGTRHFTWAVAQGSAFCASRAGFAWQANAQESFGAYKAAERLAAYNEMQAECLVKLGEAMDIAERAANVYGLPQTVFRTPETFGWANTNPFASFLAARNSEVFATMLPRNYFAA